MATAQHWLSFHIFYHAGNRDHLLVDCVLPIARELLLERRIASFFFVRYHLGGPHVRLRLLPRPGLDNALREIVHRRVASFLLLHPSPAPLTDETIHVQNRSLLNQDHNELDDIVCPDNTCQEQPFLPEVDRYGGPDFVEYSIDFFALSSARVLRLLVNRGNGVEGKWMATALRLLVRQTLGFARDSEDLTSLSEYSARYWQAGAAPIQEIADRIFEKQRESFLALVSQEIDSYLRGQSREDTETARYLDWEIRATDAPTRWRIVSSQLHMTANRLGLRNADEIYLARILRRSLDEIQFSSTLWQGFKEALAENAASNYRGQKVQLQEQLSLILE